MTAGEDGGERRKRTSWTWRHKAWGALVRLGKALVQVLAMNVIIMIVMMFLMVAVSSRWGLALC